LRRSFGREEKKYIGSQISFLEGKGKLPWRKDWERARGKSSKR